MSGPVASGPASPSLPPLRAPTAPSAAQVPAALVRALPGAASQRRAGSDDTARRAATVFCRIEQHVRLVASFTRAAQARRDSCARRAGRVCGVSGPQRSGGRAETTGGGRPAPQPRGLQTNGWGPGCAQLALSAPLFPVHAASTSPSTRRLRLRPARKSDLRSEAGASLAGPQLPIASLPADDAPRTLPSASCSASLGSQSHLTLGFPPWVCPPLSFPSTSAVASDDILVPHCTNHRPQRRKGPQAASAGPRACDVLKLVRVPRLRPCRTDALVSHGRSDALLHAKCSTHQDRPCLPAALSLAFHEARQTSPADLDLAAYVARASGPVPIGSGHISDYSLGPYRHSSCAPVSTWPILLSDRPICLRNLTARLFELGDCRHWRLLILERRREMELAVLHRADRGIFLLLPRRASAKPKSPLIRRQSGANETANCTASAY